VEFAEGSGFLGVEYHFWAGNFRPKEVMNQKMAKKSAQL
jgi:hypothetical protein